MAAEVAVPVQAVEATAVDPPADVSSSTATGMSSGPTAITRTTTTVMRAAARRISGQRLREDGQDG